MGLLDFVLRRPRAADKQEGISGAAVFKTLGSVYTEPLIDAARIRKLQDNAYYAKARQGQINLVFPDVADVEVVDTDTDEADEELTKTMKAMCKEPDINLDAAMRKAYGGCFDYGAAPFNPVWSWRGAEYRLLALRYLPSESFAYEPMTRDYVAQSDILRGIIMMEDGSLQYWQQQSTYTVPVQLHNVRLIKDPSFQDIAGRPIALPIFSVINMLKFCWTAQMQLINRVGSPPLFGKILEDVNRPGASMSDEDYLDLILKNWGKNVAFQLRSNMGFEDPKFKDNRHALDTIQQLETTLDRYFSPINLITGEGNTIGGSSKSELELQNQYIRGIHRWIEEQFEDILNHYLDVNGYDGYAVRITIPEPSIDRSEMEMKQAMVGFNTKALTLDERREKLGARAADDEIRAEIEREFATVQPSGIGFGPGSELPRISSPSDMPGTELPSIMALQKPTDRPDEEEVPGFEYSRATGAAMPKSQPNYFAVKGNDRPSEAPGEKKAEAGIAEDIQKHTEEVMAQVLRALRKDDTIKKAKKAKG